MGVDLFAGLPVTDLARSLKWYERFLGAPPAFFPHDAEAVWAIDDDHHLYVVVDAEHAGHGRHVLVFVDDLDARLAAHAAHGLEPARIETYDGGVRKVVFADPDGNEVALGGVGASGA